ncbi:MAG: coiled-coil domain-containing protein [Mycobacteriales bacterium]
MKMQQLLRLCVPKLQLNQVRPKWERCIFGSALVVVVALLVMVPPAFSAPDGSPDSDPEGGSASLRSELEKASRGYVEAKAKLDQSRKKDDEIGKQIGELEQRVQVSSKDLQQVAAQAYIDGSSGLNVLGSVLASRSFDDFLQRVTYIGQFSQEGTDKIRRATDERKQLASSRQQLKDEIAKQQEQEKELAKRKADAEKALGRFGGDSTSGYYGGPATANPAPRRPDGTWPRESCALDDPTTTGCLTARTLNAFNEARGAGFTRYTRCYRVQRSGEHGKGRACDFAAATGGFEGAASGGDKEYGNRLAGWLISNSDRIGVLYVIWYRQIWLPGAGWRSYSGGGDPSAAHTNHVHLSIQ